MAAERITVMGIRPGHGAFGPAGHHLRWMFPPAMGFPPKGFLVYRRPSGEFKPEDCLDLSDVSTTLPSGGQVDGVHFYYPGAAPMQRAGSILSVTPVPNGFLELRFPRPMVYVHLDVSGIEGTLTLRAYAGGEAVAASSALSGPAGGTRRIEVVASFITRVTIPLRFRVMHAVCFLSEDAACALNDWTGPGDGGPVELPLVESVPEALARLEPGLANRYARDPAAAARRYEKGLPALIEWLHLLQDPSASVFENPGASPDRLRLPAAGTAESPLRAVAPQSVLLLAALDPNIARFLSLYWVDADGTPNGPAPDTRYDYRVVGKWEDRDLCGLLLGVGRSLAGVPVVDEKVEAEQLAGLQWRGRDPLARVGVRWPRPKVQLATEPVLFDLWRLGGAGAPAFLTEKLPAIVDGRTWTKPRAPRFVDAGVPLGTYRYRLAGIDLFGQVGAPVESAPLTVRDLDAPPPPVRVRAVTIPATLPAALDVQFEFGDAQDRQAPDVAGFKVYWRADSRFARRPVRAEAVARDGRPDGPGAYMVKIETDHPLALADFVGGVLDGARSGGSLVAAAERRRYRVAGLGAAGLVRLAPTSESFTDGRYDLVSAPDAITGWTELALEIKARRPHVGPVLAIDDFRARAAHVRLLEPLDDVLGVLAAERRPEPALSAPPIVEVFLDRALLEPGLFAAGTAHVGGAHYPIFYSTAGPAFASGEETAARVGLPAGAVVDTGAQLTLSPPSSIAGALAEARRQPRGGLAVVMPAGGHPTGTAHLVGAVATAGDRRYTVVQAEQTAVGLELALRPRDAVSAELEGLVGTELVVVPMRARSLRIEGAPPAGPQIATGGDLAFESAGNTTHVVRVVSEAAAGAGHFDVLVRLSAGTEEALRPGITRGRYFAPYRVALRVDAAAAAAGRPDTIPFSIPPGEACRSLYIAASAYDVRSNPRPPRAPVLSTPVEVTLVRPAPSGRPGRPFPCDLAADAEAGYATPPDLRGRATVCLAWDRGDVQPVETVRYEVARASDVAILAGHRRNWLLGRVGVDASLEPGPRNEGTVSAVTFDAKRGFYGVTLTVALSDTSAGTFVGGRLVQPPLDPVAPGDAPRAYFQVTAINRPAAGPLRLLLRPMGKTAPAIAPCTLEGPAGYAAAAKDVTALRRLAAENADAFGVVTGVPIDTTRLTDEITGLGRNRFFYRVRAVDAAGNTSAWSEVSAPFHQVDTTPPPPPHGFRVMVGDRSATLVWLRQTDDRAKSYEVFRSADVHEVFDEATAIPYRTVAQADLSPQRLVAVAGSLTLPQPLEFTVPAGTDRQAIVSRIAQDIVVREVAGGPGAPTLYDAVTSQPVFEASTASNGVLTVRVTALTGLRPSPAGAALAVIQGQVVLDDDASAWAWTDTGLESGGRYLYRLAGVRAVPAGPTNAITVRGRATDPIAIEGLDRSRPPTPNMSARWVDAVSGAPVTVAAAGVMAEITVGAGAGGAAEMMLQTRALPANAWQTSASDTGGHWRQLPAQGTATARIALEPSRLHEVRGRLRTSDGRLGDFSPPLELAPLP